VSETGTASLHGFLATQGEEAWDRALTGLLAGIHAVDRNATRIWFGFWPAKLTRELRESDDPLQTARELLLYGEYELQKSLDQSVAFLFGSRFWPEVRAGLARYATQPDPSLCDIDGHVRKVTEELGSTTGASPDLLLGITAVGMRALAQMGLEAFDQPAATRSTAGITAEKVYQERRRESRKGLFGFLRTVDQRHRVRWDESDSSRTFEAVHGQDLTMAGAAAGDYSELDPRRIEGPVPIQCRNGACGFCWVGVLEGTDNLSEVTPFERRRMETFGYVDEESPAESHPPIRLGCQARVQGDVTLVIPPWNGFLNGRR